MKRGDIKGIQEGLEKLIELKAGRSPRSLVL